MKTLNLKVGDRVCYIRGNHLNAVREITEVTKVTPTGRIRIAADPDKQFRADGWELAQKNRTYIVELTPTLEKEVTEENVIAECKRMLWRMPDPDYVTACGLLPVLKAEEYRNRKNSSFSPMTVLNGDTITLGSWADSIAEPAQVARALMVRLFEYESLGLSPDDLKDLLAKSSL